MAVVVDTNVAVVASGLHEGAVGACVNECTKRLAAIKRDGGLLIDDSFRILSEYRKNLDTKLQTGTGFEFYKWAMTHQAIPKMVTQIKITPRSDGGWRQYEEFPNLTSLSNFDKKDQKFVAVALASGQHPPILNAVDSDWWIHRAQLDAAGVMVDFLCPQNSPTT